MPTRSPAARASLRVKPEREVMLFMIARTRPGPRAARFRLSSPQTKFPGQEAYPALAARAAALMHSLACSHALADSNNRLALMATVVFLRINGYNLDVTEMKSSISRCPSLQARSTPPGSSQPGYADPAVTTRPRCRRPSSTRAWCPYPASRGPTAYCCMPGGGVHLLPARGSLPSSRWPIQQKSLSVGRAGVTST